MADDGLSRNVLLFVFALQESEEDFDALVIIAIALMNIISTKKSLSVV